MAQPAAGVYSAMSLESTCGPQFFNAFCIQAVQRWGMRIKGTACARSQSALCESPASLSLLPSLSSFLSLPHQQSLTCSGISPADLAPVYLLSATAMQRAGADLLEGPAPTDQELRVGSGKCRSRLL